MQVVALRKGFTRKGELKTTGDIFDSTELSIKHDDKGQPVKLPKWVKAAPDAGTAKREAAAAKAAEEKKLVDGVKAASGGAAARQKVEAGRDLAG